MKLEAPIISIKGIGPRRAEALGKLGLFSLRDLLYFAPRDYQDFSAETPAPEAAHGAILALRVMLAAEPKHARIRRGMEITTVRARACGAEPEDKAALGDSVTLYVSTGPEVEVTPVPDLYGKTENEAAALLTEAGLLTGEISRAHDASVPAGQVISQGIEKDTDAELGTAVDLVVSLGQEPPKTQFLASLQVTYPLMISFGPGAESSEVQILIRLKQTVNGKVTYTKLAEPKAYSASTMLDIRLDHIRGADGVSTGEVEIVDLTNNVVLTSYNVNFVETEV